MKNRPPGIPLGRLPESAPWRLHGNHSAGQGSVELRDRVRLPASFRRRPYRHRSRVGRRRKGRNCIYRRIGRPAAGQIRLAARAGSMLVPWQARLRTSRSRCPVRPARPTPAFVPGGIRENRAITYGDHMMAFDELRTPPCGRVVHESWITAGHFVDDMWIGKKFTMNSRGLLRGCRGGRRNTFTVGNGHRPGETRERGMAGKPAVHADAWHRRAARGAGEAG